MNTIKHIKNHDKYSAPVPQPSYVVSINDTNDSNNIKDNEDVYESNVALVGNIHVNEVISRVRDVLLIEDFPDDKIVKVSAKFMITLESLDITISKK